MREINRMMCSKVFKKALYLFFVPGFTLLTAQNSARAQALPDVAAQVNVFLGTSGDHGQMSPAASYPLSMLSIGPQTYPKTHTGYEHSAKKFLGFTHNRFEGVGCTGSGGNLLIKPFIKDNPQSELMKAHESAKPGYYGVTFTNKVEAEMAVYQKSGIHRYQFPTSDGNGFYFDLSHTLGNSFVAEEHQIEGNAVSGWIEAKTTCNVGKYRLYYYLELNADVKWETTGSHQLLAKVLKGKSIEVRVSLSSVSIAHAKAEKFVGSFDQLKTGSYNDWNKTLNRMSVKGNPEREKLFYSLLYRTLQSPYEISEKDGSYRTTNGTEQKSKETIYNGWAIWDNYRTQLPLLSIGWPEKYKGIVSSLSNLYQYGKQDYATQNEPSNTVRTEHAGVVLLDAYRKGYPVNFNKIIDSLIAEGERLDFSRPDKALESSYDIWALSEIFAILKKKDLSEKYKQKALEYKVHWNKDFKDLSKPDVDKMQARGLYQGTIWQYRWFVPFDVKGLIELTGGKQSYTDQLDQFFNNDYYNHANEPDLQVPLLYNASPTPWKSQDLMHKIAVDTVIQYYFNDNSRGIDPFIDVIYKNEPKAYIRTMDDDAGAMSAWYIFTSLGFSPACVGWPVYYLNVPLFESAEIKWPGKKPFKIQVENYSDANKYIKKVILNGKEIHQNYITQNDIINGGTLLIVASDQPDTKWGVANQWISAID
jgi:putative alpha-1,2-mannosidase